MKAFDYLVAAVAYTYAFELEETGVRFPSVAAAIIPDFENRYHKKLDQKYVDLVVDELDRLGLIKKFEDRYAGTSLKFTKVDFDSRFSQLASDTYGMFLPIGDQAAFTYDGAMRNPSLWDDLDAELQNGKGDDYVEPIAIPASDRTVTILHNSEDGQLLSASIGIVVENLETNNELAVEAGPDRERLISEGKAGLELLKGDVISYQNVRSVILSFLQEVMKKFRERAASWSVDKAIDVILRILEIVK